MIEYTVKVWPNGDKYWYLNGKVHREDGPAIECANVYKAWCLSGEIHREDGPALEDSYGFKSWWLKGKNVTEKEHKRLTSPIIEMTMEEISRALGKQVKVVE